MSHTPGPWRTENAHNRRYIHGVGFDEIAELRGALCWDVQDDNARLITAAPDLLKACEALLIWMDGHSTVRGRAYDLRVAHNAIAKATGKATQ